MADGGIGLVLQDNCRVCGVRGALSCPQAALDVHAHTIAHFDHVYPISVLQTGEQLVPRRHEPDRYCLVRSGWIGLFANRHDGSRQLLRLALPGEAFWLKAYHHDPAIQTAEALTPASCCWLSQAEMETISRSDQSYLGGYITGLERELALAQDSMINLGRKDAATQITQFLVSLAMRSTGKDILQTPEPCKIPLTQRTIGEALGLTHIHVNRTIRHLRCEGLLTYQGGVFMPLDPVRISDMIDLTPEMRALWLARPQVRPLAS
jgi:CRP-like cAMP-binding protein